MTEWSEYVKRYAKKYKMSYREASMDSKCKENYHKKRMSPKKMKMHGPGGDGRKPPVPRPRPVPRPGFPVLINNSYGGFGLSQMAIGEIKKVKPGFDEFNFVRHDPDVIAVVTRLGLERSQDRSSTLEIVYCTEGRYFIDEYDGAESMVQPSDIEEKWISKE